MEVDVWLREPPLRDQLAPKAYDLVDVQGLSMRAAAEVLQQDELVQKYKYFINSGVVWQLRDRYYAMIGEPKPDLPYNSGQPRQQRSA